MVLLSLLRLLYTDQERGRTLLMMAVIGRKDDIASILMGAPSIQLDAADNQQATALIYAAQVRGIEATRQLIRRGANVEATDRQGYTALMWAANCGVLQICQALIKGGARIDRADPYYHFTPLLLSARNGHTEVVRELLSPAPARLPKSKGGSSGGGGGGSRRGLQQQQPPVRIDHLAKGCRGNRITALSLAAGKYKSSTARLLVEAGADVNARNDMKGETPLMMFAKVGDERTILCMLEAGADLTIEDVDGRTARDHALGGPLRKKSEKKLNRILMLLRPQQQHRLLAEAARLQRSYLLVQLRLLYAAGRAYSAWEVGPAGINGENAPSMIRRLLTACGGGSGAAGSQRARLARSAAASKLAKAIQNQRLQQRESRLSAAAAGAALPPEAGLGGEEDGEENKGGSGAEVKVGHISTMGGGSGADDGGDGGCVEEVHQFRASIDEAGGEALLAAAAALDAASQYERPPASTEQQEGAAEQGRQGTNDRGIPALMGTLRLPERAFRLVVLFAPLPDGEKLLRAKQLASKSLQLQATR